LLQTPSPSVEIRKRKQNAPRKDRDAEFAKGIVSPHTGQSSQLVLDANERNTQILPTVARSAVSQTSRLRTFNGRGEGGMVAPLT